jgi:heme exporter protein A
MQIIAENLTCVRSDRVIFRGLTFGLRGGGATALVGPNGSGKTTLLRVLAGLLSVTVGRVQFTADDGAAMDHEARDRSLHFVSHHDTVKSALSVSETLRFHADILDGERDSVAKALKTWDIERLSDAPGALLSAGQRRRVALARLALQSRPLWLLDEPLVALDRAARGRLHDLCAEHRRAGGLIVAASHEPFLDDAAVVDLGARA